jgi:hypothetical protein
MLRKLTLLTGIIVLYSTLSFSQWVNQGAWPDTSIKGQNHAMDVDPDGKVWATNFGLDTTVVNGTDTLRLRRIRVFNPDGSQASFSPISFVTVAGVTDTLLSTSNFRGMRADNNGNILFTNGNQTMYRLNYQTGEGMNKVALGLGTSPTAPAVADNGNIFVGPVVNAALAIQEYTSDFTFLGNSVSFTEEGFSRSMEVSPDGNTIYFPIYTKDNIYIYNRPSDLDPFVLADSIFGPACESIAWNPATGHLWFSGGSFNDRPDSLSIYTPNTWYAYDVSTKSVVDSLKWEFNIPDDPGARPRAIAFSPDGNTAYIGCFGGAGYALIQKVVNTGADVKSDPNVVVTKYTLAQNYPNPFNPTTDIKFTVAKEGFVTLRVYDLLGKEISTLVNQQMISGGYSVDFDASNLASGTYIYTLSVNGVSISKKMMLLK